MSEFLTPFNTTCRRCGNPKPPTKRCVFCLVDRRVNRQAHWHKITLDTTIEAMRVQEMKKVQKMLADKAKKAYAIKRKKGKETERQRINRATRIANFAAEMLIEIAKVFEWGENGKLIVYEDSLEKIEPYIVALQNDYLPKMMKLKDYKFKPAPKPRPLGLVSPEDKPQYPYSKRIEF